MRELFSTTHDLLIFLKNGSMKELFELVKKNLDSQRIMYSEDRYRDIELHDADTLDSSDEEDSCTLLDYTVAQGNYKLALELYKHGYECDKNRIIRSGNLELIQGVFGDLESYSLHKIAREDFGGLLKVLNRDYILSHIEDRDEHGMTPVLVALHSDNVTLARTFIQDYGASVRARDNKGRDGLHLYLINGRSLHTIKDLVSFGGDTQDPATHEALYRVINSYHRDREEDMKWIRFLLENRIPVSPSRLFFISNKLLAFTGFSYTSGMEQLIVDIIKTRIELPYIFNKLCSHFPVYNEGLSGNDCTISVYRRLLDVVLEQGHDINSQDDKGMTALFHCRSRNGVQYLLEKGIRIDIQDNVGRTAIGYFKVIPTTTYGFREEERNLILNLIEMDRKPNTIQLNVFGLTSEDVARILREKGYQIQA